MRNFREESMITGMEHIGLCAENPKELVDWYVNLLGFRIVRALEEHRVYFIRAQNGGMLEIFPATTFASPGENVRQGLRHIALTAADVDEEVVRLRSANVPVPEDTIVVTPLMKLAFFRDPEGNLLHLVERKTEIP
jgi:glyoxylase I family protein